MESGNEGSSQCIEQHAEHAHNGTHTYLQPHNAELRTCTVCELPGSFLDGPLLAVTNQLLHPIILLQLFAGA